MAMTYDKSTSRGWVSEASTAILSAPTVIVGVTYVIYKPWNVDDALGNLWIS
jgi:hypothetical protein